LLLLTLRRPPSSPLLPYTTLFRSGHAGRDLQLLDRDAALQHLVEARPHGAHRTGAEQPGQRVAASDPPHLLGVRAVLSHGPILRSEEHTSELQSRENLVCRLLLEK